MIRRYLLSDCKMVICVTMENNRLSPLKFKKVCIKLQRITEVPMGANLKRLFSFE